VLHSDQELQPPPAPASTSTQTSRIWGLRMLGVVPTSYPLDMGGDVGVHSWSWVVQASAISLPKGYDADQEPSPKVGRDKRPSGVTLTGVSEAVSACLFVCAPCADLVAGDVRGRRRLHLEELGMRRLTRS